MHKKHLKNTKKKFNLQNRGIKVGNSNVFLELTAENY